MVSAPTFAAAAEKIFVRTIPQEPSRRQHPVGRRRSAGAYRTDRALPKPIYRLLPTELKIFLSENREPCYDLFMMDSADIASVSESGARWGARGRLSHGSAVLCGGKGPQLIFLPWGVAISR
jgi:hypothetical protein